MPAYAIKPSDDLGPRQPRQKDRKHLEFIRSLRCLTCSSWRKVQAAHVRYGDGAYGKRATGMAEKPDDKWTVPLCSGCHLDDQDAQHRSNEREWWEGMGIDPLAVAQSLYDVSGDLDAGMRIIREA